MDAQRAHELMEESRELIYEISQENSTPACTQETICDEEWLLSTLDIVMDSIEEAASLGKNGLQIFLKTPQFWMFSDDNYAVADGEYAFLVDPSCMPDDLAHVYVPVPQADPADYIPMLDIIGELLEEDGYVISNYYSNGALSRFLTKLAQKKNGLRVSYDGEDSDPNLLFYW